MPESDGTHSPPRLAGYSALTEKYHLEVLPNWHQSAVAIGGTHRTDAVAGTVQEVYPAKYWPGDSPCDQLEFALKYDGTNLGILSRLFTAMDPQDLVAYIRSKPTGKYARRTWFLYEFLTGQTLPLDDIAQGNYVELLDPETYFTATPPEQVRRQRINNNLLGDARFCPVIRRTDTLRRFESADLPGRCREIVASYPPQMLKRALSYLYTKETKSSFEIEHITPSVTRTERFVALLQLAEKEDFCDKSKLIELQNRIVDPRFRDADYRASQNYIGQTVAWQNERVHYVGPKPEDVRALMAGLIDAHRRMVRGAVPAVLHAASVGYGFVFIHPFEDGNGRIHRFLIHNILGRRGFTPEGTMFPVSAAMLKNAAEYDASLEAFSRPIMALVDYNLDNEGRMVVVNDVAAWYRYVDMTAQAEALYRFIERAIETELVEELAFLASYDETKRVIQEIVDMPDRQIDLFIRLCLQNHGRLSARKKEQFAILSDDEIARMEVAIHNAYGTAISKNE